MPKIRIDTRLCIKCGGCVEICPEAVFIQKEKNTVPKVSREKVCVSCGHCVETCPVGAIIHKDFVEW